MSLGLVHRKELQKRRAKRIWGLTQFVLAVGFCSGVGYYAYEIGLSVSQEEVLIWKTRHDTQVAENDELKIELGKDKATVDQLSQLLPNEEIRSLLGVVTRRANEGVDISRMETILGGISKDADCSGETDTKRFIVLTPVSTEEASTASFYRGLITLSGRGSPTLNDDGNPEAWFDTTKEITVSFMMPGGDQQEVTGTLPLYHSVITGGSEYRFSITAGRTSFVDASVQKCGL
jgi:hypothetical protein|tara:strand:+ start:37259 stop:37957 length:699 start_codon:yes stop_codon:yes gene_type:complete